VADEAGARLVMRKEAGHSLILNVALFKGMSFSTAQDPRYIRFSAIEDGTTTHYNLRVRSSAHSRSLAQTYMPYRYQTARLHKTSLPRFGGGYPLHEDHHSASSIVASTL
jgi:hypothetical protein